MSSHPRKERPAFVGVLYDFENPAMLSLSEDTRVLLAEVPQKLRPGKTERLEVNSWATSLCQVSCCKPRTAAVTHSREF